MGVGEDDAAQGGGGEDEEEGDAEAVGFGLAPVAEAVVEGLLGWGEGFGGLGGDGARAGEGFDRCGDGDVAGCALAGCVYGSRIGAFDAEFVLFLGRT